MRTTLTVEQSAKLIELGVPKERASIAQSIFTIADLLSMLPYTIEIDGEVYDLILSYSRFQYWRAYYSLRMNVLYNVSKELIDALWDLLADLIENNYVNPQEL